MKTQFTSAVGIITGKIKNNPTIYASKNSFSIFLNGELIVVGSCENPEMTEMKSFAEAKKTLEKLKFGEFECPEIQKRFDSFIRE